ncbi:MAG: hypothetical protein COW56_12415 [Rhodocyclales bacterium CG17_big_fil_post_rev_8_21_14_2_50_68_7]|nr:MAG: hypothetical protein COW56_12415 [Rhodocyclales bacterium CG17_big_fil_post_rev_8_21_14_2_50_68_7]PIX76152.1 MAG: hypothetical protein COZ38_01755 [Rhodocyclales bacterium CG_4_10_14_3_um_filter_68_10]
MSGLRLLHLDAFRLTAYRWSGAQPIEEDRFRNDAGGHEAFLAYLLDHPRSLYRMLADIQDEGFGFESIPYVTGADRKALLSRKLNQHFLGTPYACAISHGREPSGRRDERVLLAALTRPQVFAPWLALMRSAEIQLAGIHSAPQACQSLVERIAPAHREHLLLVTSGAAGVRQTYFAGGILRFSRLSAATEVSMEERARICAQEPAKLYQYLVSQRILPRDTRLPTLVLCGPPEHAALAQACRSTNEIAFEFADLGTAEAACGMKPAGEGSSADRLLLHLIARKPPKAQFAGQPERHLYAIGRLRFAILAAAAVVFAGCLLSSARHLYEARSVRAQTNALAAAADEDARRYDEIMNGLPPMPAPPEIVRQVVGRYEAIERRSEPIEPMLRDISRALEAWREVELERLDWQLTQHPGEAGEALRPAQSQGAAEGMYAVALVSAVLPRLPPGEQRRVIESIEGFAAAIAVRPEIVVRILKQPFDLDPGRALRGGTEDTAAAPARFVLRVSRPVNGTVPPESGGESRR